MKSISSAITVLLFCTVVAGVYLYAVGDLKFGGGDTEPSNVNNTGFLKTPAEMRRKLAQLRLDQEKVRRRRKLTQGRKQEVVDLLKKKGVDSNADLSDDDLKYEVRSLKRYVEDIREMDSIIVKYDKPIAAIEAMLKLAEQERIADEVAISDEKAAELGKMIIDLDEKLGVDEAPDLFEEDELRSLLSDELGSPSP